MDPSLYALQISLSMEAGPAFDTLDEFGENILKIEGQVADAGKKAVSDIDKTIKATQTNLNKIVKSLAIVDDAGIDEYKRLKEKRAVYEETLETAGKELDNFDEYTKVFEEIIGLLDKKNERHEDELEYVRQELPLIQEAHQTWQRIPHQLDRAATRHGKLLSLMRDMYDVILALDEETENFVTTNYRWYGSQYQLVQQTRELSFEYGILRTSAIEAYKVLGNLKIPVTQLRQYAKAVAEATRYTGVGIQDLGQFSFRMRQVGWDALKTERSFIFLANSMRKFGLDTHDVDSVLKGVAKNAAEMNRVFGPGAAEQMLKIKTVMVGLGKQAGLSAEGVMAMVDAFQTTEGLMTLQIFSGQAIKNAEDFGVAFGKMADTSAAKLAEIESSYPEWMRPAAIESWAQAMGLGTHANMEMMASISRVAKEMSINLQEAGALQKVMDELTRRGIDPYNEANQTLTAQLRILRDRVVALIGYALTPLGQALFEVVKWINITLDEIIKFGKGIYAWGQGIYNNWIKPIVDIFPELKQLGYWLKVGAAAVLMFGLAVVVLGGIFGLIPGMLGLVRMGIVGLFRAVGLGIQAFGRAVASVMVPLLALGAAFLMVGAGVYLFGQAFQAITENGWAGIGMFAAMVGIMALLGLALVGLGYLAMGAAPGILIVAGAILAVGAAALMVGYGIKLAAQGFELFVNSAGAAAAVIPPFVVALLDFGKISAWTIAKIGALAIALGALALPLTAVAFAMGLLALSIPRVNFGVLGTMAGTVAIVAVQLTKAAVTLLPAATALGTASAAILAASVVLIASAVLAGVGAVGLAAASLALVLAGAVLVVGGGVAALGAGLVWLAGVTLVYGAGYLLSGAVQLAAATVVAVAAGAVLIAASVAIGVAAAGMFLAAGFLMAAGVGLSIGGALILVGGGLLQVGAVLAETGGSVLASATNILVSSAGLLLPATAELLTAGLMLAAAGVALLAGGIAIAPAAIAVRAGVWAMHGAFQKLATMTPHLMTFAAGMKTLSESVTEVLRLRSIPPVLTAFAMAAAMMVTSFGALQRMPADALSRVAEQSLSALPGLTRFVTEFEQIASRIDQTTSSVIANAEGINAAIAKVSPALVALDRSELGAVRSEAIQTVQILDKREGDDSELTDDTPQATLDVLKAILNALGAVVDEQKLAAIHDLLEQRLPTSESTSGSLLSGSELSSWRR